MRILLCVLFCLVSFTLYSQGYNTYGSHGTHGKGTALSGARLTPSTPDTSPPDTLDTPITLTYSMIDTLLIGFTPSEIDSTDWKDIVLTFSFAEDNSVTPTSLTIPRATALADSDTVIVFNYLSF